MRLFGFRMDFHWAMLGSLLAIVGYQIVLVNFFAKLYAMARGIREEDRFFQHAFRLLTLERVLLIGAVAVVIGMALDGFVAFRWLRTDLGVLVSGYTRVFIFGSTLVALGRTDDLQRVLPEHPARRLRAPSTVAMRSGACPRAGSAAASSRPSSSGPFASTGWAVPVPQTRACSTWAAMTAPCSRGTRIGSLGCGLDPCSSPRVSEGSSGSCADGFPSPALDDERFDVITLPRGARNTCGPPTSSRGAMPASGCWCPAGSSLPPCPPPASTTSCTC